MLTTVVLDVNETLTDMSPLRQAFVDVGAPAELAATWFATVLKDAFALTAAGGTASFKRFARAVLLSMSVDEQGVDHVLDRMAALPLHPDVADGLRALHERGLTLVTFTNGAAAMTEALLERNGLRDIVTHVLSVDDAGAWKPTPTSYRYAQGVAGAKPDETVMVAVHPWDTAGAQQVGWQGAWVDRAGTPWPEPFDAPTYRVRDLTELAAVLG